MLQTSNLEQISYKRLKHSEEIQTQRNCIAFLGHSSQSSSATSLAMSTNRAAEVFIDDVNSPPPAKTMTDKEKEEKKNSAMQSVSFAGDACQTDKIISDIIFQLSLLFLLFTTSLCLRLSSTERKQLRVLKCWSKTLWRPYQVRCQNRL